MIFSLTLIVKTSISPKFGSDGVNRLYVRDIYVASSPGLTQFFNVARRKTRRPGKIDHVRDVGWRELGNWPATGARARHELAINKSLSRQQSTSHNKQTTTNKR